MNFPHSDFSALLLEEVQGDFPEFTARRVDVLTPESSIGLLLPDMCLTKAVLRPPSPSFPVTVSSLVFGAAFSRLSRSFPGP